MKIEHVALVANPEKPAARAEVPRIKRFLKSKGIKTSEKRIFDGCDAVITLGGDGTILAVAEEAALKNVPVLGVNIGRLGFMTGVGLKDLYKALPHWLLGKWPLSERLMLEVRVSREPKVFYALNDAVIRIGSITRVTQVAAAIEKESLGHFVGDGVIVSTSTGSTAYSLSAQGPVVHPDVDAILLTPICAHSFSQRPVVFPAHQHLELQLDDLRRSNEVQLCLDGQKVLGLRVGDVVKVTGSTRKLKLYYDPKTSYFGMLRDKLLWGGR